MPFQTSLKRKLLRTEPQIFQRTTTNVILNRKRYEPATHVSGFYPLATVMISDWTLFLFNRLTPHSPPLYTRNLKNGSLLHSALALAIALALALGSTNVKILF